MSANSTTNVCATTNFDVTPTFKNAQGTPVPQPGAAVATVGLALALGILLSMTTIAVEEFTYHRHGRGRDLIALVGAVIFAKRDL